MPSISTKLAEMRSFCFQEEDEDVAPQQQRTAGGEAVEAASAMRAVAKAITEAMEEEATVGCKVRAGVLQRGVVACRQAETRRVRLCHFVSSFSNVYPRIVMTLMVIIMMITIVLIPRIGSSLPGLFPPIHETIKSSGSHFGCGLLYRTVLRRRIHGQLAFSSCILFARQQLTCGA